MKFQLFPSIISTILVSSKVATAFTNTVSNNNNLLVSFRPEMQKTNYYNMVSTSSLDMETSSSVKYETDVNVDPKFKVKTVDPKTLDPKFRIQPGRYNDRPNSVSVPFLLRPSKLDGSHAGDIGFDPLGLTEQFDLYTLMEAEVRHARLAMLAVMGWPLSELVAPNWMLHGPQHIAPSVLNGFDPLSFLTVAAIFGGAGYFEYKTALRRVDDKRIGMKHAQDMANVWKYGVPGDYNFDPLKLYSMFGDDATGRKAMRELEISHGRWAMMGITSFVIWEALTGHAIVENNMFFHPNALLPTLALAYGAFGFFYEIKNTDQYLFQIEKTSEGEARLESIQRNIQMFQEENAGLTEDVMKVLSNAAVITKDTFEDLKEKYEQMTQDYTANVVMSKNYDSKEN